MSPVCFWCIICGVWIDGDDQDSWLREFRIGEFSSKAKALNLLLTPLVYTDSGTVFVSGVGLRDDAYSPSWPAPLDEGMRWNDQNYDFQASDRIPVMWHRPVSSRHGFVLHDACWCLLKTAFDTESVPLGRLFNICESLPFFLFWDGVCWDHGYGGSVLLDQRAHYPWEDWLTGLTVYSEIHRNAQANPYDVPDISQLLVMPSDHPPDTMPSSQCRDCFTLLPWEILEGIAKLLPTTDALTLRLASRSFICILRSQSFWASRFAPGRERDFVFEMRKGKKCKDWRLLYRRTGAAYAAPGLQNRRRIWSLIQVIKEYLGLRLDEKQIDSLADMNDTDLRWNQVRGDISQEPGASYCAGNNQGSRIFNKVRTFIPKTLSKVAFSVVQAREADYVVGLRLITVGGDEKQLGYCAEGRELFFEVRALTGFAVAVGPRGIRALQVICDDGTRSPWFGRPGNTPITERLVRSKCITALEVGFDVSSSAYRGTLGIHTNFFAL